MPPPGCFLPGATVHATRGETRGKRQRGKEGASSWMPMPRHETDELRYIAFCHERKRGREGGRRDLAEKEDNEPPWRGFCRGVSPTSGLVFLDVYQKRDFPPIRWEDHAPPPTRTWDTPTTKEEREETRPTIAHTLKLYGCVDPSPQVDSAAAAASSSLASAKLPVYARTTLLRGGLRDSHEEAKLRFFFDRANSWEFLFKSARCKWFVCWLMGECKNPIFTDQTDLLLRLLAVKFSKVTP